MHPVLNVIDGKPTEAAGGATTEIVDPCTGQPLTTVPLSVRSDVDEA